MKKLLIALVLALFCAGWWSALTGLLEKPAEYRAHIQKAEAFEEQEIYYDAILEYKNALEFAPDNMELRLKLAQSYRNLGDEDGFVSACNDAINLGKDNEEAVFLLTDYYLEAGQKASAIALLKNQIEKTEEAGAFAAKLQSLAGGYSEISGEYDSISESCGGVFLIAAEGKKGLLLDSGQELIRPQYEEIGLFGTGGFASVKKDGKWYCIDTNNYKRRAPKEAYEYLGIEKQGVLPACMDGKWGYINADFQPLTDFSYEGATPVLDGIGALKKDGKWALVGEDLKRITDYEFDDIVVDEWGFCSRNGIVFVKSGGKYSLIDKEGLSVGKETFEEVKPFTSQYPAAVKQDGKWGFVTTEGALSLACVYEEAKSFSAVGYAPVRNGDKWGYIKENGDFVVEPEFDGAKGFNSQGIAPVLINETWRLIQLDIY